MHTLAIAGISGYTGQRLLHRLDDGTARVKLLLRAKTAAKAPWRDDARAVGVDLLDEAALTEVLRGVDTIVCLVGTTKAQFRAATADEPAVSYETVDIGIPRALASAGKKAGCTRFVLLTSFGIDGPGAYTSAKREAEAAVRASGLEHVFIRPSFIVGDGRRAPKAIDPLWSVVGIFSRGYADDIRSIDASDLACAIHRVAIADDWSAWAGRGLTGRDLHAIAKGA